MLRLIAHMFLFMSCLTSYKTAVAREVDSDPAGQAHKTKEIESLPKKCQKRWLIAEELSSKKPEKIVEFFKYTKETNASEDCLRAESSFIGKNILVAMDKQCGVKIPGACLDTFLIYRAAVIDNMYDDKVEDAKILFNKIVVGKISQSRATRATITPPDEVSFVNFAKTRIAMADFLTKKLGPFAELDTDQAIYLAYSCSAEQSICNNKESFEKLTTIKGRRINNEISEAYLIFLSGRKDYKAAQAYLESQYSQGLDETMMTIWKAYLLVRFDRRNEAIKMLEDKVKSSPDETLKAYLQGIKNNLAARNLLPTEMTMKLNTSYIY